MLVLLTPKAQNERVLPDVSRHLVDRMWSEDARSQPIAVADDARSDTLEVECAFFAIAIPTKAVADCLKQHPRGICLAELPELLGIAAYCRTRPLKRDLGVANQGVQRFV